MATITRGQITIVDLNDSKSVTMYLSSNQPATQIFNQTNGTYVPDFKTSPYCVITPEIFVSGSEANQAETNLKGQPIWKINGSTNLSNYGATVSSTAPYSMTIKSNLTTYSQLQIECTAIYVDPGTGAETTAKATITITKVQNSGEMIRAVVTAPLGSIFKNNITGNLTAHCDMYRGSSIDDTDVEYTWQKLIDGVWTNLTTGNAMGITGYNTNEISIPASAVLNFESFKCVCKDTDASANTYNTTTEDIISFADMSDPYTTQIEAPKGTVLSSGLTSTTLKAQVWRAGELLDDTFFVGATCTWRKYNKTGVVDTSWGTDGVKTGREITIDRSEISVAATFTVDISK